MRVEDYIKQLLYRYDCVIVPGLGAFIAQKNTSQYDEDTHEFTPPFKEIVFNKAIQNQDGLLAETIAKAESMDFESAKYKVQLFVDDFFKAIAVDKHIKISKLGTFSLDSENNLSFQPLSKENYLASSFGLSRFQMEKIASFKADVANAESTGAMRSLNPVSLQEQSSESKSRPYLKYAAVGILALGIAGFAGFYQYKTHVTSHNYTEAQKAESLLQEKIQSAEFSFTLSEIPLKTTKATTPVLTKYHIVAGAFRIKANADKKVQQLQAQGYRATLLGQNAYGLHQVAFASYADKKEAINFLNQVKANQNPDAWLFVKQL
jgi:hypothetical protein